MEKQTFYKHLDQVADWKLTLEENMQGRKKPVPIHPDSYPIIKKLKEVAKPCQWCNNMSTKPKEFKKNLRTGLWSAKCLDCKEIHEIPIKKSKRTK